MKRLRWLFPIAVLLPYRLQASDDAVRARVATATINPAAVTVLHLRLTIIFGAATDRTETGNWLRQGAPSEPQQEGRPWVLCLRDKKNILATRNKLVTRLFNVRASKGFQAVHKKEVQGSNLCHPILKGT
jgi:hypothetical protein